MRRRNVAISLALPIVIAFVFFVPVVFVGPALPVSGPIYYLNWPAYGSLSYWAFGVGGEWMYRGYYALPT